MSCSWLGLCRSLGLEELMHCCVLNNTSHCSASGQIRTGCDRKGPQVRSRLTGEIWQSSNCMNISRASAGLITSNGVILVICATWGL